MMRLFRCALAVAALLFCGASRGFAADAVTPYEDFVRGAQAQHGLFTVWRKAGKVYLELGPSQLDRDFIETIVPSNGLGGRGFVWGNTDDLPAQLVRFERAGSGVAIVWENSGFIAPGSPAATSAIEHSFARTIAGTAPIVATDPATGRLVIDAAPFLDDQIDLKAALDRGNRAPNQKGAGYTLDRAQSYFGATKAFPRNVVLEALQDWTSPDEHLNDLVPDARHLQMRVTYNIVEVVSSPNYRPRFADDRVGVYDDIYLQFSDDRVFSRKLRYTVRWNFDPADPGKPSPARHPMIFYLSNTIPERYRPPIRDAVLAWNAALERIGILDGIQVREQPDDPNWDPDDVRYNVLRWVTESRPSFGADSQTLFDPNTGEEFRTGILISADVPLNAFRSWTYVVDPVRYGRTTDPMPQKYLDDAIRSTILHETGHNLGLQHNFIGSMAYTAANLQDPSFTAKNGITSTVMEYAPLNIWPKKYGQGDFQQIVLGPYDYYAIRWAYASIPGAQTPEAELPTLSRWAQAWSDPRYRYASDEDASWGNGHASDPRSNQGDLTNDPLTWCTVQMDLDRRLMSNLDNAFPRAGDAFESERDAFMALFARYSAAAMLPTHFIGGQYLSRAHAGDPNAEPPVAGVPRSEQRRAFEILDRYLFAPGALRIAPSELQRLGYSEWAGYGYPVTFPGYGNLPAWAYDPPARHDLPLAEEIGAVQDRAIAQMFAPLVLARLDDGPQAQRDPMRLSDLFAWMHEAVYRELRAPHVGAIDVVRRSLQQRYLHALVALVDEPQPGTPGDARALARGELFTIEREALRARSAASDAVTRAHIGWLALEARADHGSHGSSLPE